MKKIDKIKKRYSLKDVAERLSQYGKDIYSTNDILLLALEGEIKISWYSKNNYGQKFSAVDFSTLDDKVFQINSFCTIDLSNSEAFRDFIETIIYGARVAQNTRKPIYVVNEAGQFLKLVRKPISNSNNPFFKPVERTCSDAIDFPSVNDLGVTKIDVEDYEKRLGKVIAEEKPLHVKEKISLLKLVAGMAGNNYGYEPSKGKNSVTAEIVDDLASQGIKLDEDTVRKWLAESGKYIVK